MFVRVVLSVRMLIEGIATFGCSDRSGCREFGHTVVVCVGGLRSMFNVQLVAW